jgi:hypothetical protein
MKISKRKLLLYGALAVTVAIGLWLGGYSYFINSDDWSSAEQVISKSEPVISRVGVVQKITLSPLGFYYRFSGDWAQMHASMTVIGDKAEARFKVEMEMANGRWILTRIETL